MSWRIGGITIIDVCRELGVEPVPELTWSVGNRVRDLYEARYRALPEKDLRSKTSGTGSHCFAVYPEYMRDPIITVIRAHVHEQQRQGDMFGHAPNAEPRQGDLFGRDA